MKFSRCRQGVRVQGGAILFQRMCAVVGTSCGLQLRKQLKVNDPHELLLSSIDRGDRDRCPAVSMCGPGILRCLPRGTLSDVLTAGRAGSIWISRKQLACYAVAMPLVILLQFCFGCAAIAVATGCPSSVAQVGLIRSAGSSASVAGGLYDVLDSSAGRSCWLRCVLHIWADDCSQDVRLESILYDLPSKMLCRSAVGVQFP